jgi:phage terminase small subunit
MTPKQEAFAAAYLAVGNASEAYRRVYSAKSMSAASVNRAAKALMDNPKIAARVAEMRAPAVKAAQMTVESHLADLKRIRDAAFSDGKYSAAAAAEMARGKVSGFYVDRVAGANGEPLSLALNVAFVSP